jgi:hypothetical protein
MDNRMTPSQTRIQQQASQDQSLTSRQPLGELRGWKAAKPCENLKLKRSPLERLMAVSLLWLGCLLVNLHAGTWCPSEAMLRAVRHVESDDGRLIIGDHGKSLGDYQISEAAWVDVNAWRKSRGMATFAYESGVWSERISREYARDYLRMLHRELAKRLCRPPTAVEVYAAYNQGLSSFAQGHYHVGFQTAATRIQILLSQK